MYSFVYTDRELREFSCVFTIDDQRVQLDLFNKLGKGFYDAKLHQVQGDVEVEVNSGIDLSSKRR